MSRNPLEWVGIGLGAAVAIGFVLIGLSLIVLGLFLMWQYGLDYWRTIPVGVFVALIPPFLYGLGRASGRAWTRLNR